MTTGNSPQGVAAQAEESCKNVGEIPDAAGVGFDKAVKTIYFLSDMRDFTAFNVICSKYFTSKPARGCVAVKTLPKNALREIEAAADLWCESKCRSGAEEKRGDKAAPRKHRLLRGKHI